MNDETEAPPIYSGTHIHYYFVCKRKLWLFAHSLSMEQTSEEVSLGRLIHETAYPREKKEFTAPGVKIDILREREGELIVGEVKKSSKSIKSATMQLTYYLWRLKQDGIEAKGELLVPEERKKISVELTEKAERELQEAFREIYQIISQESPPLPVKIPFCRNCAYREFCWV